MVTFFFCPGGVYNRNADFLQFNNVHSMFKMSFLAKHAIGKLTDITVNIPLIRVDGLVLPGTVRLEMSSCKFRSRHRFCTPTKLLESQC